MEAWLLDLAKFGCVDLTVVDPDILEACHWGARLRMHHEEHAQPRYFKTATGPASAVFQLYTQVKFDFTTLQALEEANNGLYTSGPGWGTSGFNFGG